MTMSATSSYKSPTFLIILLMMMSGEVALGSRSFGGAIERAVDKTGYGSGADDEADLMFYAHVDTSSPGIAYLLSPVDPNTTASFGQVQAFALNITSGADAATSQLLGVMYGYTIQTSYTASVSRAVEVEVLSYDDGAGVNGTISLQGLVTNTGTTIAVVGGTGSFAGVRGYDVVAGVNGTSSTYQHSVYFQ